MTWPLAYFLTWTTYGTWLHGDPRGSFAADGTYLPPDEKRRAAAESLMTDDAVTLTPEQRAAVEAVIVKHCQIRRWELHARSVRTNHVHAVVSAPEHGDVVREQLKAWAARALSEHAGLGPGRGKDGARRWWTEKGNIEEIWHPRHLDAATRYVNEGQDP